MRVIDKKENYKLYDAGLYGNRLLTFPSLDSYYASGYEKPVVMRYKGPLPGRPYYKYGTGVTKEEVPSIVKQWQLEGADPKLIVLNELANDAALIIQGEVMRSTRYFDVTYSTAPKPMRTALKEGARYVHGLEAKELLKNSMDEYSYCWLNELFDMYPDSVIEFSVWAHDVGDYIGRNTVFWEVRNY